MATSIRITGLDGVVVEIAKIPKVFVPEVIRGLGAIAYEQMRQGAGRHSPRSQGTGRLYNSLFRREEQAGEKVTVGHDQAIAPHAIFVVRPTIPHWIRPRNAKMLSWLDLGNFGSGKRVFAKEVWHPGYRGDPYDEAASQEALRSFSSIVNSAFAKAI